MRTKQSKCCPIITRLLIILEMDLPSFMTLINIFNPRLLKSCTYRNNVIKNLLSLPYSKI